MNWKALSTWFYLGAITFILYVLSYPFAALLGPVSWSLETRMLIVAAFIFVPFFSALIMIIWRAFPNPEDGDRAPTPVRPRVAP